MAQLERDLNLPALRVLFTADPVFVNDGFFRFVEMSPDACLQVSVVRADLARYVQSRMREQSIDPAMYLTFLSDFLLSSQTLVGRMFSQGWGGSNVSASFAHWGRRLSSLAEDDPQRIHRQFQDMMTARSELTFAQRWMNVCLEMDRVGGYYSQPNWFLRRHTGPFSTEVDMVSITSCSAAPPLPPLASYREWRQLEEALLRLLRALGSLSTRPNFARVCCIHPFSLLNLGYPSLAEIAWHETRMAALDLRENYEDVTTASLVYGHPERVLRIAEFLVFLGATDADKSLGASYLLAALTQVDSRARTWFPWLYSFYRDHTFTAAAAVADVAV